MRTKVTAAEATPRKSQPPPAKGKGLVGKVIIDDLSHVTKNDWNPNRMTPFERQSLRHGLEKDGWLVSHALTVWGTDEKGKAKNLIIDGEHRWEEARALGMTKGPMVYLEGLTLSQAKQLTVKLDSKRGRFDEDALGVLVRSIQEDLNLETQSLDLGIEASLFDDFLRIEEVLPEAPVMQLPAGQKAAVKTVPLFFQPKQYEEFMRLCQDLSVKYQTQNSTDTVVEAVKRAHAVATAK